MVLCAVVVVRKQRSSNFKSKKERLLVTEHCSNIRKIASIFLDTYSLNIGLLPVLGLGLLQIFSNALFFLLIILFWWPRLN